MYLGQEYILLEAYRIFADVFRINKAFSLCNVVANLLFQYDDDDDDLIIIKTI